jgi:hypothetical protein
LARRTPVATLCYREGWPGRGPDHGPEIWFTPRAENIPGTQAGDQYAVLAAAALHGGTEPGPPGEIVWWQTDDFW